MRRSPLALLLAAAAALPAGSEEESPRRRVIEQKAALVQRVLQDSAVARRVAAGASEEARAQLARASQAHGRGLALAAEGQLAAGEAALDEAMAAIGLARRLQPGDTHAGLEQRARFAARRDSTEVILAAARRQAGSAAGSEAAADIERGARLVALAAELASAERHEEASRTLYAADAVLLEALARALGTKTIDYTPRFDSPQDELRHEGERYGSFQRLLPIALANLRPSPAARELVEEHVRAAARLHEAAAMRSSQGEHSAALEASRQAIEYLQRALRAAGLVMPTP